jgi:hypothetical protein
MRRLHIVLWVVAGALGGAVVTRVWQARQAAKPAMAARVEQPARAPAPEPMASIPPVTPPPRIAAEIMAPAGNPEPVAVPESDSKPVSKPSPARPAHRTEAATPERHVHRPPPPAHPRPLDLGDAIPPSSPAPQTAAQPQSAPEPPEPGAGFAVPPAPQPVGATPAPAPEPEPSHTVTLNAGMVIPVRLLDGLSSDHNQKGDTFSATLDHELVVDGWVIAERGARVEGRVVASERGGATKGSALAVELTSLRTSDGQKVVIQTDSFERHSAADRGTDAAKVGGGAIIGAVIGGIVGGGKGAAIGAGAGAGVGAGDVMLTHKPAMIPTETRINFRLRSTVTLTEKRG